MQSSRRFLVLLAVLLLSVGLFASEYNAQPKLMVIVVVDQLRGDLLERYHDEFTEGGFRRFMDHGAWFTSCYYQYANTKTAPGHATLGTGTYTLGHGILANEWYDPKLHKIVTSVEDANTHVVGENTSGPSASPHNLLTTTIGDEVKLATVGRAKVYGVAFKDRAAILPVGHAADGAFWIDAKTGAFVTSSFYMQQAPAWLDKFNSSNFRQQFLNREWKDAKGNVLRTTKPATNAQGAPLGFFDLVGPTPFANDYTIEAARQIVENEKLGTDPVSDLLEISFSATDILGHKVGPDSPQQHEMLLALDRSLAGFFSYLDKKIGAGNWAVALSADHGVAPMSDISSRLRLNGFNFDASDLSGQINRTLSARFHKEAKYVVYADYPTFHLDPEAFAAANVGEAEAEAMVGDELVKLGVRGYNTKTQLASGDVKNYVFQRQALNAYSPEAGWYLQAILPPFQIGYPTGTGHALPYSYDAHVPLGFYGTAFRPGVYRENVEPIDMAVTVSSLLRINKPASATGRVLNEAFADNPTSH